MGDNHLNNWIPGIVEFFYFSIFIFYYSFIYSVLSAFIGLAIADRMA